MLDKLMILINRIKNINGVCSIYMAISVFYESNKKNQFENAFIVYENENKQNTGGIFTCYLKKIIIY